MINAAPRKNANGAVEHPTMPNRNEHRDASLRLLLE